MSRQNDKTPIAFKDFCYSFFKRFIDILGGIVGCVILIPVLIVVKIAFICCGDAGRLIFTQERIGKNGKKIKIHKIRSMVKNADQALEKLLMEDEAARKEYEQYKKLKNDPRITRVGKFIRNYSIDEIPQFFDVLLGKMSLVGPRPYLWREREEMGEGYDLIITCKPGISGYWQVNGRSNTDFAERLVMEKYYCKHKSTLLDLQILFKTFYKVIKKDGAE